MAANRERTSVSLFSGCGGLDLGIEAAGWTTLAQVEMNPDCAQSLRNIWRDRPHRPEVLSTPIENVNPRSLRKQLSLRRGELGLLVGGPPCQPFTTHGLRKGIADGRASTAFPSYVEFVREFQPQALLLENVDGLLSAAIHHRPLALRGPMHAPLDPSERKGSFLKWLLEELAAIGYSVTWGLAEAADHGVPQRRQRAVLVGVRGQEPFFLPRPTHGDGRRPCRTFRDAAGHLASPGPVQPLSIAKRQVFELIPPGGNWRDLPRSVQRRTMGRAFEATGGKSGWWRRLSWDAPTPTVLGMPDHASTALVHPDEVRCLGLFECAAAQTFQSAARLAGTPRSQYQQIGNAVPPRLARAMGRSIARFLDGKREQPPEPPEWRKTSANRRIGTHGWAVPGPRRVRFVNLAKIREDHVWQDVRSEELLFGR